MKRGEPLLFDLRNFLTCCFRFVRQKYVYAEWNLITSIPCKPRCDFLQCDLFTWGKWNPRYIYLGWTQVKFPLVKRCSLGQKCVVWPQLLYLKNCRRHESNYIVEVRRSKHWPEHTNNRFSFPSVARFLRFLFSAIFSSYLESSAVYSLLLWASTVYKHTTRRLPF